MVLTGENYYTAEANSTFLSVTQYKDFAGTYGRPACEDAALAKMRGELRESPSTAMLTGSYVDAWFEGTLSQFRIQHPEMYKRDGSLKADFQKAEDVIARVQKDRLFMAYMSGEKQVIMTGVIGGAPWKIKMDSYLPGKAIVDLKVMSSISKLEWVRGLGYLDFVRYWGYDLQGAVYQEIVRQNTGERLPFYIAAASKEREPDIEIIHVANVYLDDAMNSIEARLPRIIEVREGLEEPERCGVCDWCRRTKVLKAPVSLTDLTGQG